MSAVHSPSARPTAIAFLHGWGLHAGVWDRTRAALGDEIETIAVDLPGFGGRVPLAGPYSAEALARAVADDIPAGAVWVGWSLGGLAALAAARLAIPMRALVLVGATPRFVRAADWPYAIASDVLAEFAGGLEQDYRATVLRFLAVQARGSTQAREELRALRESVFARGEPDFSALRGGLDVLRNTDLRSALHAIDVPALIIHGTRDTLAPFEAAASMAGALPRAQIVAIDGAGHAPFLSHPDAFVQALRSYIHG